MGDRPRILRVAAVVLAAGVSSRMGRPKALLPLGGRPMLQWVLEAVGRSRVAHTIVVLGHEASTIRAGVPMGRATVVLNRSYAEGLSGSIRAGLQAVPSQTQAALMVLGDQPFVTAATLDDLIVHAGDPTARIVIPTYHGRLGNPVLLHSDLFADAKALVGDRGFKPVFEQHIQAVLEVPVEDPGVLLDIDTEERAAAAQRALERGDSLVCLLP